MKRRAAKDAYALVYVLILLAFVFSLLAILLQVQVQGQIRAMDQLAIRQAHLLAESGMEWGFWHMGHSSKANDYRHEEALAEGQEMKVRANMQADGFWILESQGQVNRARASRTCRGAWLIDKVLPDKDAEVYAADKVGSFSLQQALLDLDPEKAGVILVAKGQRFLWPSHGGRFRDLYILSVGEHLQEVTIPATTHVAGTLAIDGPLLVTGPLTCDRLLVKGQLTLVGEGTITCDQLILAPEHFPEANADLIFAGDIDATPPDTHTTFVLLHYLDT